MHAPEHPLLTLTSSLSLRELSTFPFFSETWCVQTWSWQPAGLKPALSLHQTEWNQSVSPRCSSEINPVFSRSCCGFFQWREGGFKGGQRGFRLTCDIKTIIRADHSIPIRFERLLCVKCLCFSVPAWKFSVWKNLHLSKKKLGYSFVNVTLSGLI